MIMISVQRLCCFRTKTTTTSKIILSTATTTTTTTMQQQLFLPLSLVVTNSNFITAEKSCTSTNTNNKYFSSLSLLRVPTELLLSSTSIKENNNKFVTYQNGISDTMQQQLVLSRTMTSSADTKQHKNHFSFLLPLLHHKHPQYHAATPITIGWFDTSASTTTTSSTVRQQQQEEGDDNDLISSNGNGVVYNLLNRNARRGKRANRGKRPVSRQARRKKRRSIGNHRR